MALSLDLRKSAETLKLCLAKAGMHEPPVVEVAFNMDVSGSFTDEHTSGATNILMNRLVPWGMVFDPDKKLDFFSFSDGAHHVKYVGEVTDSNCEHFIKDKVIRRVPGWNGGTTYADVLLENLVLFGWEEGDTSIHSDTISKRKPSIVSNVMGFFGFGKKEKSVPVPAETTKEKRRSLIIHVTDGETYDENSTYSLLSKMRNNGYKVYVQFFGMGIGSKGDRFLKRLAADFDNVGYYSCDSVSRFNNMTDEEINDAIISDELLKWLGA